MITALSNQPEQRREPRMPGPFPLRVRSHAGKGSVFEVQTVADDLSNGGLYMQIPVAIPQNQTLFTITKLPGGALVAARGRVLRCEEKAGGLNGIAIRFNRVRLLPGIAA